MLADNEMQMRSFKSNYGHEDCQTFSLYRDHVPALANRTLMLMLCCVYAHSKLSKTISRPPSSDSDLLACYRYRVIKWLW